VLPTPLCWALTMGVVVVGWFLFRVTSLDTARALLASLGHFAWKPFDRAAWQAMLAVGVPVFLLEWWQGRRRDALAPARLTLLPYSALVGVMLLAIFARFYGTQYEFIYFRF
jgi:hypothetical protein